MAKKKQPAEKPNVPCLRVVVGGKKGEAGGADATGCKIVGESRGGAGKFHLGKEFGATSKSVSTPKKNKPCLGALDRKGCPVQLAFDKGQPFLRFCTTEKKAGIRINVGSPAEATAEAKRMCDAWEQNNRTFPQTATQQLGRRK